MNRKLINAGIVIGIILGILLYTYIRYYQFEAKFYQKAETASQNSTEFRLDEVTSFEWDSVSWISSDLYYFYTPEKINEMESKVEKAASDALQKRKKIIKYIRNLK